MTGLSPERVLEQIAERDDEDILTADGLDEALLGLVDVRGHTCALYSTAGILAILVRGGMDYEEAREFFEFNIAGAMVGPHTPVYLQDDV